MSDYWRDEWEWARAFPVIRAIGWFAVSVLALCVVAWLLVT